MRKVHSHVILCHSDSDDMISRNGMIVACDDMISSNDMLVICDDMISCNGIMVAFW